MSEVVNEFEGMSLMDLAGLDVSGLSGKRIGDVLPRMFADFDCTKAELKALTDPDNKLVGAIAQFEFTVLGVHSLLDDKDGDVAAFIGKVHQEARFIKGTEGLQFCIGFLEDIGVKEKGTLQTLIDSSVGKRIRAQITHRKDKNDADKVYAGLAKIKMVE